MFDLRCDRADWEDIGGGVRCVSEGHMGDESVTGSMTRGVMRV